MVEVSRRPMYAFLCHGFLLLYSWDGFGCAAIG